METTKEKEPPFTMPNQGHFARPSPLRRQHFEENLYQAHREPFQKGLEEYIRENNIPLAYLDYLVVDKFGFEYHAYRNVYRKSEKFLLSDLTKEQCTKMIEACNEYVANRRKGRYTNSDWERLYDLT